MHLRHHQQHGLTMLELLVAVLILIVVLSLAVPAFRDLITTKRLYNSSERLINHIRYYHSEAIRNNSELYISFQPGSNWCYGVADTSSCDCSTVNSCMYNSVETVFNNADYPGIALSIAGLSNTSGISHLTFNGTRGTVATVGSISLSNSDASVTIAVNKLGRTSVCSSTMKEYEAC